MELKGRNDAEKRDCFALTSSYAFSFGGQVVRARNDMKKALFFFVIFLYYLKFKTAKDSKPKPQCLSWGSFLRSI